MLILQLGHDQVKVVGNLPIFENQFYKIWIKQYESELTQMFEEYIFESNEEDKMGYKEYCQIIFQNAPHLIENNLS